MVMGELVQDCEVVVIGGGPGGYAAAFRAADLGMDVTLIDTGEGPGGVCLFRGCIPSKTYLTLAELLHDADRAREMGITFGRPDIDIAGVRGWKQQVVDKLAKGLMQLTKARGIQLLQGRAAFKSANEVRIPGSDISGIRFKHAVIATGSRPIPLPDTDFEKDGRIMSSTAALSLPDIPKRMLVVGGGYVGLEIGMIYAALGSEIHLVEMGDRLLPGIDDDLTAPLKRRLDKAFKAVHLNTRVSKLQPRDDGVDVSFSGNGSDDTFDRVLVAVGRAPNTRGLGLENTRVRTDDRGFVIVDDRQRTGDENIFAVGDVTGGMMLAHKASREGKIAAEVMAGQPSAFDAAAIPAVVYTDPQIAYCGLTETAARQEKRTVEVRRFPWKYSGRAVTLGTPEGMTKMIVDPESQRILGVGIVGRNTEGLISEGVLAVEMGAVVQDVAFTIHPHPTLSETEAEAAELFLGGAVHAPPVRK
ncbi:dihydrolipoamide dehydrogenase [Desulfococcus multivorans DSM 2059]|uniref:Dihydrolipoyl dehydrogenase n=2 Tax=Desulfococcus multivorans TaxID=897 RepID=S7U5M4_DESML|nr:LpdA2: dihydrolipoyl dehydrogenase (E3 component of 2-oxoglutarate dehydrogenase complex) [Desulfococcus multivorans]EPR44642.1 dihydrolipoamide dehydrogenase [Desulfococcus multivorans DSM 2059]SKA07731.1 dihydrolipoamide dehydrogenase [Desulfococcus multivorans DSM 2059]